ncbi:DNA replication regulator sld2 [Talaromyces islandicus]|uniref:DNA replication regulator SLD2 n=1 Tax=Talaromyces islandicus TaxID=28573 RepID=A0A0U1LZK0_TALIS|nr:DNA replication regulator sld2 [Talaromyces islandicus]
MPATTVLSTAEAAQLNTLRAELKQWEKSFSDANGGKKAGRQDIKQDPEIAAKYKTYGRLRALESSSSHPKSESRHKEVEKTPSKSDLNNARVKRKHSALGPDAIQDGQKQDHHTPKKSRGSLFTPAKNRTVNDPHHPATLDPYDSPSVFRRLFSPSTHRHTLPSPVPLKSSIGPTPQRDGKALGLFDLLSVSGGSTATPSAKRMTMVGEDAAKTPSGGKRKRLEDIAEKDGDGEDDEQMIRMGRTPASSSKKLYLERLFATPTTMRFATMVEDEERQLPALQGPTVSETRAETNPLCSETPSFLRRSNSGRYIPKADPSLGLSPVGVRKPQRFVGKGLSALVQGLRDMEEERMQDDWDILKELEAEQDPNGQAQSSRNVQVSDSQVATNSMDPQEDGPIWKKKAPKRTTRLVRLKPVMQTKPKTAQAAVNQHSNSASGQDEENEEDEDLEDFMPDDFSDSDFAESTKKPNTTSSFSEKIKAMISGAKNKNPLANVTSKANNTTTTAKADNAKSISTEKEPKKRKVNPDAHANYRSLKIRSRGQGRFGRRFGRR